MQCLLGFVIKLLNLLMYVYAAGNVQCIVLNDVSCLS